MGGICLHCDGKLTVPNKSVFNLSTHKVPALTVWLLLVIITSFGREGTTLFPFAKRTHTKKFSFPFFFVQSHARVSLLFVLL